MSFRRLPYRRDVAVNRLGFTVFVYGIVLFVLFAARAFFN